MAPSGYEYVMCKSSQSVQWDAFSGQIPFIFKTPNRKWCKGRECFLAIKPRIIYNDGTNQIPIKATTSCVPYLVKNPCSVLFSTGKVLVNDKLISNMNELSATNTLFRTIFDTRAMQETVDSSNPIFVQSIAEDRITYANKCQLMFDKVNEETLTWSLPFPLFQSNEWIPPHSKVEIDLNVNNNWQNEIISCVGKFPAGGIVKLSSSGTNPVANSIGVGIDDMTLWLYYVTDDAPVNMVKEIQLKQYFSQIHTITSNNESFTLTLPNGGRAVTHLLACFLQTKRGSAPTLGSIKASSNDFSSGYIGVTGDTGASGPNDYESKIRNDAVTNLQMIRFMLDKNYPNPDYTLDFTATASPTNNVLYNSQDLSRAFYDFLGNSMAKFDRSGNCISIHQFIREPIFCFRVNSDATTYNETLQVQINLGTGYSGGTSQLLVVALYDETLRLQFDSEKIINVELIS